MRQLPVRASALVFHLRRVIGAVVALFDLSGDGPVRGRYRDCCQVEFLLFCVALA